MDFAVWIVQQSRIRLEDVVLIKENVWSCVTGDRMKVSANERKTYVQLQNVSIFF